MYIFNFEIKSILNHLKKVFDILKYFLNILLLLSCHQTAFFHCVYTLFGIFVELLKVIQSGRGCASNGHCNIMLGSFRSLTTLACCVSVEVLPSLTLLLAACTPMRNLLRHLHVVHGLVCPFAKLSSRLTAQLSDAKFCQCCHSLQRMTFTGKSAGRTELRKHFLFERLSAGTWACREWATFASCFFYSTLAHTSLLVAGGAIPANRYSCSTLVEPQTSGDRSTCVVQFRIQFGSM